MLGIRNVYQLAANLAVAASAALVTAGLKSPIAAGQTQKLRYWLPFSVGAAGGIRAQVVVPAGGTAFVATFHLVNTVAPSMTGAAQVASAAFTNALANAGNHFLIIEVIVVNGATAGDVDLQVAQNTSDATAMTLLRGATVEVIVT